MRILNSWKTKRETFSRGPPDNPSVGQQKVDVLRYTFASMELYDGRRRPKGRENALRIFVMSSIADDYEDFEMVEHTTIEWAKEDGWQFSRQEILGELAGLIRGGHAQAYLLSTQPPHVVISEYSEETLDALWFYLTPIGIEALRGLDMNQTV